MEHGKDCSCDALLELPEGTPIFQLHFIRGEGHEFESLLMARDEIAPLLTFEMMRGMLMELIEKATIDHTARLLAEAEARGFASALNIETELLGGGNAQS